MDMITRPMYIDSIFSALRPCRNTSADLFIIFIILMLCAAAFTWRWMCLKLSFNLVLDQPADSIHYIEITDV